ncbi:MAG: hypothetical protein ACLTSX_12625 [Collinsella sp.]
MKYFEQNIMNGVDMHDLHDNLHKAAGVVEEQHRVHAHPRCGRDTQRRRGHVPVRVQHHRHLRGDHR